MADEDASGLTKRHDEYYGISGNYASIAKFYRQSCKLVYKWINRYNQRKSMNWEQFFEHLKQFPLLKPETKHNIYIYFNSNV